MALLNICYIVKHIATALGCVAFKGSAWFRPTVICAKGLIRKFYLNNLCAAAVTAAAAFMLSCMLQLK